ncbi:hypothetical protein RIF29_05630 [Crotalaria pallida]|uniref:HTH myb-type domain-containing protein n=1 Tax=Crotalaria pallida TaxID=3830 RepID=A0AAN9J308_CROPI
MESFAIGVDDFAELSEEKLLESINFDDLFDGINGVDILPDLEMDLDVFTEFSVRSGEESSEKANSSVSVENNCKSDDDDDDGILVTKKKKKKGDGDDKGGASDSGTNSGISSQGEEMVSERDDTKVVDPSKKEGEKGRKSSAQSKNPHGKRKAKVDWTPELHRRFVQAVEQLGVDKAVPSRILEIMGIDGLTRHNIASHLQKYRSHRKHLLAREVEAASWSQRKQSCGSLGAEGGGKREVSPWIVPTIGFPPMTPTHHFRPLHVWGHPKLDQSFVHIWPKHLQQSPSPWAPPIVPSPHAPNDPSYWHQAQHQRAPNALTPGTPCFPQPLTTTKFGTPTVPGIPPPPLAMYKLSSPRQQGPRPFVEFHPSTESVDATIGDLLSKPWLPLPLGLKAPALDSVMDELQRQGVPKIPPFCA